MKKGLILLAAFMLTGLTAFSQTKDKIITKTAYINFFSHTSIEDISADNYAVVSSITTSTGKVVFSVPMQSFKFEKSMMQKHFNRADFLYTKQFPKAKFKGEITNLSDVDFKKNGTYNATFEGEMTIRGVTKKVTEKGNIQTKDGLITIDLKLKVALADYKIALKKGKPSKNVAKEIDVTIKAEYKSI
jgi:polyisoprenoid-binding protein YceI